MILIVLLLNIGFQQPCSTPTELQYSSISGSCTSGQSADTYQFTLTVSSGTQFTISGWFQLDTQGTDQQGLFFLKENGLRVGFGVHDQIIDFLYESTTVSNTFAYTIKKWFFVAASISYSTGKVAQYVWLPKNDLRIAPSPITLSANFNTALTSAAILYIFYSDSYTLNCGKASKIQFYDSYYEGDNTYNWINLAFLNNTAINVNHYSLEDQNGQKVIGSQENGYLGSTKGSDSNDPTPGYYVNFAAGQFITLPASLLQSNQQSISFWLWTNAVIQTDAFVQSASDTINEMILFRRIYSGTQDMFQILLTDTNLIEFNIGTTKSPIQLSPTISLSTWTYISLNIAYLDSSIGISKVFYSGNIGGVQIAHTQSSLAIQYSESNSDIIYLGDSKNDFTNNMRLAQVDIRSSYVNYYNSVNCLNNCIHSSNSFTQTLCERCNTQYLQDNQCVSSCAAGQTGYQSTFLQVCSRCSYQCATCSSSLVCLSCNSGYYLSSSSCVIASSCSGGYLADPISRQCTTCGDGIRQGSEACDDGNFISNDGCSNCIIDSNYECDTSNPNVCQLICGNGVLDSGEQCDIGSLKINGCVDCIIQSGYYCSGTYCDLLCGDGQKINEDCDDGNYIDNDGCSKCEVDVGYLCTGGTSSSADTCTQLCPNGIINQSEQCDDNNNTQNDGCYDCRIEIGFTCSANVCTNLCGNGVIDLIEECDDGNLISGDGCSNCNIDYGYLCADQLTCVIVTPTCGDSYHSLSEACEDGNVENGDGCSDTCQIETDWECIAGLYNYSLTPCNPICGDGIIITEQCDDGNLIDGDGCSRFCTTENVCGNAILEVNEQCDDGNTIDMDGCTNCIPDPGYNCTLIEGGTVDQCNECSNNCDSCLHDTTQCITCFSNYVLYNYECYTQCPQSYYVEDSKCLECPNNCYECNSSVCMSCSLTTYLYKEQCITTCPDGYFQQSNGVLGNSCIKCYSPCVKCSSEVTCLQCDDTYRLQDNTCVACGFTSNCVQCNEDSCLECVVGYQPDGQDCKVIEANCGDGLHATSEQCDDGNTSDGCINCAIQSGYNCILEQNQGPDICYKLEPVTAEPYLDEIHFDTLYLEFDRPLSQIYTLTDLLFVDIPTLVEYDYVATQFDLQHIQIVFQFNETVQNVYVNLNFSEPNQIVDKFGWSLVGLANDSNSDLISFGLIKTTLNFYIYYTDDEISFSYTLRYIILSFLIIGMLTSLIYSYKIGNGQVWQIIQSLQLISLLRLINLRYSIHIERVLNTLNWCNLSFIPNIFSWFFENPTQNTIKFQIEDYPQQFILNAGGRLISLLLYSIIFWMLIKISIKFVSWEPLLNRLEDIDEYMHFQGFIRIYEIMFLDVMVSLIQTFQVYNTLLDIVSIVVGVLFILITISLFVLAYWFILRHQDAYQFEWLHLHYSCIYDGYEIRTRLGRLFIYIPYIRKIIYSFIFIMPSQFIQIIVLIILRIIIYPPLFKFNPFINKIILTKQGVQALFDSLCFISALLYLNKDDEKSIKIQQGWYMLMAILLSIINFIIWNIILIFVKVKSPNYLLDDFDVDEPKFKENQIVPEGFVEKQPEIQNNDEEMKNNKIAPEGYQQPIQIGVAQIMPQDDEIKSIKSMEQPKSVIDQNNSVNNSINNSNGNNRSNNNQNNGSVHNSQYQQQSNNNNNNGQQEQQNKQNEIDQNLDDFFS